MIDHVARTERPTTLAAAELDDGGAASYRFYIDGTSAPARRDLRACSERPRGERACHSGWMLRFLT